MEFQTLFQQSFYFSNPQDLFFVAGLIIFGGFIIYTFRRNWETISISFQRDWIWYAALAGLIPLFVLIGGIEVPNSSLPLPNTPGEMPVMLFLPLAALSWLLAAGILGTGPTFILAFISGICIGGFQTHNYFTVVEITAIALVYTYWIRQEYRTFIFRAFRIPVVAAVVTALLFLPILTVSQILSVGGSLAVRLDYGLMQAFPVTITRLAEIISGGLIVTIFYFIPNRWWKHPAQLKPSPLEERYENRFLFSVFPFIIFVIIVLIVSDWRLAGGAARDMIEDRLQNSAEAAAESIPYFLETGQNLSQSLAQKVTQAGLDGAIEDLPVLIKETPFFTQLFLFNASGDPIAGYPSNEFVTLSPSSEELAGVEFSLQGVENQTYTHFPTTQESSAHISFISLIKSQSGEFQGVLLARADFQSNPLTFPFMNALQKLTIEGGDGLVLDQNGRILFRAGASGQVAGDWYQGELPDGRGVFESYSPQSIRQILYYQPVVGSPWSVLASIPAQQSQELALQIAGPLLLILLVILVLVFILLRLSLRPISRTINALAAEASLIAQGNLENPVRLRSADEFGQLATSFELMRVRLKGRLDELNQLLLSSKAIGQHLDIHQSFGILLEAALSIGAKTARAVLIKDVLTETVDNSFLAIGLGDNHETLPQLDRQLFEYMLEHERLIVPNLARMRRILSTGSSTPTGALLAVSLRDENEYYGVLWIGFDEVRNISDEEVRFISTLASQAAMAAANAKLYATAELGRQRLEAVLNSTPEPVMVFDENDRLLLINPAACQLRSLVNSTTPGKSITEVIDNEVLLDQLINLSSNRDSIRELKLANNQVYFISVSAVNNNQRMVGKICLLRDISHFRAMDAIKTDVVDLVSHDLRIPLTYLRGYATMIQMVGELNEQQREYMASIDSGIERMIKLVNNLLDVGRLEAGVQLKIEKVSPLNMAEQVVTQLKPGAIQKNIEVNVHAGNTTGLDIEVDNELLNQALSNLVDNALKFNSIGGKVDILLAADSKNVSFEVRDTGIGVAPLDRPHLFDKFYRSNRRESYKNRGSGLGLAIVKSIAERHNGRAWVESKLGRGSSFFLELPLRYTKEPDKIAS